MTIERILQEHNNETECLNELLLSRGKRKNISMYSIHTLGIFLDDALTDGSLESTLSDNQYE